MSAKNTIVINGKVYDAVTGLPVAMPDPVEHHAAAAAAPISPKEVKAEVARRQASKAKAVHRHIQRSQTLRRDILKKPAAPAARRPIHRKPMASHVSRSQMIAKFAPHPQPIKKPVSAAAVDAVTPAAKAQSPHVYSHPSVAAAHAKQQAGTAHGQQKPAALSSRELKQKLIAERLAAVQPAPSDREHKAPRRSPFARLPRVSTVIAASFAVIVLGGYLTYISMPNLSMRVAASRAGVDASFPDYKPDGYRFDGPIAYNSGEVNVRFASNTNGAGYTIQQKNSNWDSQAVLDNYVSKKSKDYLTYSEQGLTIYTYDGKAAWVNGGIFYSIEGDAPLSSEQILRIASSM